MQASMAFLAGGAKVPKVQSAESAPGLKNWKKPRHVTSEVAAPTIIMAVLGPPGPALLLMQLRPQTGQ